MVSSKTIGNAIETMCSDAREILGTLSEYKVIDSLHIDLDKDGKGTITIDFEESKDADLGKCLVETSQSRLQKVYSDLF